MLLCCGLLGACGTLTLSEDGAMKRNRWEVWCELGYELFLLAVFIGLLVSSFWVWIPPEV
jgi:hypothetical protein